jgi:hypothetical protein
MNLTIFFSPNIVLFDILYMGKAFWQENLKRKIAKINLHSCLHPPPPMISTKE